MGLSSADSRFCCLYVSVLRASCYAIVKLLLFWQLVWKEY